MFGPGAGVEADADKVAEHGHLEDLFIDHLLSSGAVDAVLQFHQGLEPGVRDDLRDGPSIVKGVVRLPCGDTGVSIWTISMENATCRSRGSSCGSNWRPR